MPLIVPHVADQVTAVFVVPVTVAIRNTLVDAGMLVEEGDTVTDTVVVGICVGGTTVTVAAPTTPETVAVTVQVPVALGAV